MQACLRTAAGFRGVTLNYIVPSNERVDEVMAQAKGGEFHLSGTATVVEDNESRSVAVRSASCSPGERYVLFEHHVTEARCNGYGDVTLPSPTRWLGPVS